MKRRESLDAVLSGTNPLPNVILVAVLVAWHAYGLPLTPAQDSGLLTLVVGALLFGSRLVPTPTHRA